MAVGSAYCGDRLKIIINVYILYEGFVYLFI